MQLNRPLLVTLFGASLLAAVALAPSSAHADIPAKSIYLGVYGGGHVVLDDWDLNEAEDLATNDAKTSPISGLRVGFMIAQWLGAELSGGLVPYQSTAGEQNFAMSYSADIQLYPFKGDFVPFLQIGTGVYHNFSGDHGDDVDSHYQYGGGLKGMLGKRASIRVDVRHHITDGYELPNRIAHNLYVTLGFDFFAWVEQSVYDKDEDGIVDEKDSCPMVKGNPTANGCPDADSDTVPDDVDRCPNQKGIPALGGCPDSDGDSVPDLDDKCPMVVGVVALNGCPDKDGDGVGDKDDRCPDEPGPPALAGCPDNDKDGIENAADRCPDQPGTAELQGCPDKDGDTVADVDDRCPADPGVPALKGCPDRDSDNIADLDDKCPDAAGPPERQGCPKPKAIPKAIEKKFSGALPGIYFKTGSAEILSKSFPVLNDAAKALLEYPTLRVRIEGHTDDRGGRSYNQKLSENRAKSVAAYLTAQGVAPIRMQTVGLGEDKPAATNRTAAGRAQNRRIEFHIISR